MDSTVAVRIGVDEILIVEHGMEMMSLEHGTVAKASCF